MMGTAARIPTLARVVCARATVIVVTTTMNVPTIFALETGCVAIPIIQTHATMSQRVPLAMFAPAESALASTSRAMTATRKLHERLLARLSYLYVRS